MNITTTKNTSDKNDLIVIALKVAELKKLEGNAEGLRNLIEDQDLDHPQQNLTKIKASNEIFIVRNAESTPSQEVTGVVVVPGKEIGALGLKETAQ